MRDQLLAYTAPTLLVIVACIQIITAHAQALSPWKGGGFGMFSTVDSPAARFLRVYLQLESGEEIAIQVPDHLRYLVDEVRAIPSQERLERLTQQLAEGTWATLKLSPAVEYYQSRTGQPPVDDNTVYLEGLLHMVTELDYTPADAISFQGVRAEVWRYSYDGSALVAEPILQVVVGR